MNARQDQDTRRAVTRGLTSNHFRAVARGIRRLRRTLARRASSPGRAEPQARQPEGQELHLASLPGRDGFAARLIQDLATGPSVAPGQTRPGPTTTTSRRRTMTTPRLLPHTIQLCVHCRQSPAGFWVSQQGSRTVRRPWCLSCCQDLDPACYYAKPFDP